MEIRNGRDTFFWFDHWSDFGRGAHNHRRRRHIIVLLSNIKEEIDKLRVTVSDIDEDVHKWKKKHDKYSSKATWLRIRVDWEKIAWFTHATPKYSFLLWTAMYNRLATGDCMSKWNVDCPYFIILFFFWVQM